MQWIDIFLLLFLFAVIIDDAQCSLVSIANTLVFSITKSVTNFRLHHFTFCIYFSITSAFEYSPSKNLIIYKIVHVIIVFSCIFLSNRFKSDQSKMNGKLLYYISCWWFCGIYCGILICACSNKSTIKIWFIMWICIAAIGVS